MPFVEYVPFKELCRSPEHTPPGHVVLPAGMHTWSCPSCGQHTTFFVPKVTCSTDPTKVTISDLGTSSLCSYCGHPENSGACQRLHP